jgi:hypothetical protein
MSVNRIEMVIKRRRFRYGRNSPQSNQRLRVRPGRKLRSSQHTLSHSAENTQTWLDDETVMFDEGDKRIEEKMAKTSEINVDDDGDMMDLEFSRDDPIVKSEEEGGGNTTNKEAPIYAVGRFTIKTGSSRNVSQGGNESGSLIGVRPYSSDASNIFSLRRVRTDPNDEDTQHVYPIQPKLDPREPQSGTKHIR